MSKNSFSYKGTVKLEIMKKGRRLHTTVHNTGLPDMCWMFSKAVTGNLDSSTDVPRLMDLGYEIPGTGGMWTSILLKPVNIGGRQYSYDYTLSNWIGTLVSTIYYSDLNGGILDDVLDRANRGEITIKLRLCSYPVKGRKYFAEIEMEPDEIEKIKELTSVIITWNSEIIPESSETADAGEIESPTTGDNSENNGGSEVINM